MKIRQLDLQSLLYQVNGLSVDHPVAMRVIRALENNTLEIEGYTRDEWIKFDPNDQKTFPPMYESVLFLVYWKHFDPSMRIGFYDNDEFQDDRGHYIRAFSKILWRPLPNHPRKEVSNETE